MTRTRRASFALVEKRRRNIAAIRRHKLVQLGQRHGVPPVTEDNAKCRRSSHVEIDALWPQGGGCRGRGGLDGGGGRLRRARRDKRSGQVKAEKRCRRHCGAFQQFSCWVAADANAYRQVIPVETGCRGHLPRRKSVYLPGPVIGRPISLTRWNLKLEPVADRNAQPSANAVVRR
jgi:hypothetical protein